MPSRDVGEVALDHQLLPPQAHDFLALFFPPIVDRDFSFCVFVCDFFQGFASCLRCMCSSGRKSAFDFSGRVSFRSDPRGFDCPEGGGMEKGGFLFDRSACKGSMSILGKGSRSKTAAEDSSRRRPFLCFSDDYFDDKYYDELAPEKKRRLTPDQVDLLEKTFEVENKLEPERKTKLAKQLRVEPRQVAVWFQNRRARWKNKQLEQDYDYLKSSYDSLLSNYDAVMKENEKLKSEVVFLTEKLRGKELNGPPIMEQLPAEEEDRLPAVDIGLMVEDRLSSRTGGSTVVDEEALQLVDSGNSYFMCGDYSGCVGAIQGNVFESGDPVTDVEEPLAWWVWP